MKLPVTDQFLWVVYKFFEKTGKILEPKILFQYKRGWLFPIDKDELEFWRNIERKKKRKQFSRFINYLKEKDYIKISNLKGKKGILLTPKGMQKTLKIRYRVNPPQKDKKRKDGKWIMVVFDIPEKMRKYRDDFRDYLISFGFQNFQKSIWVCPYNVLKELEDVIRVLSLDKFVRIFLVKELELRNKK